MTTTTAPISEELLKMAFSEAEARIRGSANHELTKKVTNEVGRVQYEGSLNAIIHSVLSDVVSDCTARLEFEKIDISVIHENSIVVAIESKGMVANSHSSDENRISIDLHGIRTKLYPDRRNLNRRTGKHNCVQADIVEISEKVPPAMQSPHFEVFVPVVYELYRNGGSPADIYAERKPWVTLPGFKKLREGMSNDFAEWFHREDPRIGLMHSAEGIELRYANELWIEQSQHKYPAFTSLEAYVNFYAFARFVEYDN